MADRGAAACSATGKHLPLAPREGVKTRHTRIHHICCHCYTDTHSPDTYFLEFTCKGLGTCKVSLGALSAEYFQVYRSNDRDERPPPPLVFLNACGSARIDASALSSFPDLFLQSHRGVIGTEARIPDGVAAAFSMAFYQALINGKSVGESMHAARWSLVTEYNNPLGMLYTLHADPDLRLPDAKTERSSRWWTKTRAYNLAALRQVWESAKSRLSLQI